MKTIIHILIIAVAMSPCAQAQTNAPSLSQEIIGAWQPGERMIQQPPPELRQDLKDITFHKDGLVEWSEVKNGKMVDQIGRFTIQPDPRSKRNLPYLFVAPTNYPDPRLSSICLLQLTEVQIDFDSRFPQELHGKVLKATTQDGKHLIFLKKDEAANKAFEAIGDPGSPQPQR